MMPSTNLSPSLPVVDLLRRLILDPGTHARFLNTLSLMEHIGSRKIMLSQRGTPLKAEVLNHLAEETRHAQFFRRAAERVAGRAMEYLDEDLLAPAASRMYFGRLDAKVVRETKRTGELAYRYVTWLIEVRATWLYGLYDSELRAQEHALTLKSVLAEEDRHLRDVRSALQADPSFERRGIRLSRFEGLLFEGWLRAVSSAAR